MVLLKRSEYGYYPEQTRSRQVQRFDWPESPEEEILVTYVRKDEIESDAILRAMEIFGSRHTFYIKEKD